MDGTARVLMEEMTWPEYASRIGKSIVILPVGATEQHGPHLPLGTDSMQVAYAATQVATRIGAIVAPCIPYGCRSLAKSGGGEGFPGTTSLTGTTMIHLVRDVLKALVRHGAKRIVVMDGHYENDAFLHEAIQLALESTSAADVRVMLARWTRAISQEVLDRAFPQGFPGWALEHAAHIETSAIAAIRPELLGIEHIKPDGAKNLPPYDVYPQPRELVPASGVLADPSRADPATGAMLLNNSVERLASLIREALP